MGINDLRVALSDIENSLLRQQEEMVLSDEELLEALKHLDQKDIIASMREGDRVIVFHTGERKYVEDMLEGHKAVQDDYSGYIHKGLFIAPTFQSSNRFMEGS